MNDIGAARLPPGAMGWPLLGETLPYANNGFAFITERAARHGDIFKTSLLGRKTVVISGPDACEAFIDGRYCMREGSMPPHVQEIFMGRSLPLLDGAEHKARKALVLEGFSREALAAYLPVLQKTIEAALERWAGLGRFSWLGELKRLALEGIGANAIGMGPGPRLDALLFHYDRAAQGITAVPLRLPGTVFSKALGSLKEIKRILEDVVRERRARPADDGLSRILAAKTPEGGKMTDEQAVLELHHIVVAGYIIFAEFAATIIQLHKQEEIRRRLKDEVKRLSPTGPLSPEALAAMPYMSQVVMEVKRLCPILPAIFGKARTAFEFKGFTVPEGWMLLWALRETNMDKRVYADPASFDPERFSGERAEHKRHAHAFVPHGPGPALGHKCPGADYSTWFMMAFNILLLRGYDWELPAQDLDYVWSKAPPEPKDGLRVEFRRA